MNKLENINLYNYIVVRNVPDPIRVGDMVRVKACGIDITAVVQSVYYQGVYDDNNNWIGRKVAGFELDGRYFKRNDDPNAEIYLIF